VQNVIDFEPSRTDKYNWSTIFFIAAFHLVAIAAFFTFSWQNLIVTLVLWVISASFGIGLGYHRLLTHRGFTTSKLFERFLAVCGTLSLQSGPITWVTTHRLHHAFTDTDSDPHSPRKGIWWSHMGWIMKGTAQMQPEVVMQRYSPDLMKDRFLRFLDKYYYFTTIILAAGLFAFGGISMVIWAVFLRIAVSWHFTWMVNSATHLWGTRRFATRDDSRNNRIVVAVTFGEGWHNNHHAHPRSARHGLTWREPDINWMLICLLERLGLVDNVYAYDLKAEALASKELRKAA
jgi:stearoyl-CoA desaturase (delta-9 desaturase)